MKEDLVSDYKLSRVCPDLADKWRKVRADLWDTFDRQIFVIDGMRNYLEQDADFAKGRVKLNGIWHIVDAHQVVTRAKGGQSFHNFGLAVDSGWMGGDPYLEKLPKAQADQLWEAYGKAVKEEGLTWGGDFGKPDLDHCELNFGLSADAMRIIYEKDGLFAAWRAGINLAKLSS